MKTTLHALEWSLRVDLFLTVCQLEFYQKIHCLMGLTRQFKSTGLGFTLITLKVTWFFIALTNIILELSPVHLDRPPARNLLTRLDINRSTDLVLPEHTYLLCPVNATFRLEARYEEDPARVLTGRLHVSLNELACEIHPCQIDALLCLSARSAYYMRIEPTFSYRPTFPVKINPR